MNDIKRVILKLSGEAEQGTSRNEEFFTGASQ